MIRNVLKTGLAAGLHRSGMTAILARTRRARGVPLVIGYHRVVRDFDACAATSIPSMLISTAMLERHLDWLARHYRLISIDEIGWRLDQGRSAAGTAAITFDDGYRDVYDNAFPILKRKGIPAAVFLVTGTVGTDRALDHDRLYAALARGLAETSVPVRMLAGLHRSCGMPAPAPKVLARAARSPFAALRLFLDRLAQPGLHALIERLESRFGTGTDEGDRMLTWEMVEEMRAAGIAFGSHGRTHAILPRETSARRQEELFGSRQALLQRLNAPVEHLTYPDGAFDMHTVVAAALAGYRFAYTTCAHRDARFQMLTIPRRLLWERSCVDGSGGFSEAVMACVVGGLFDPFAPCRQPHGAGVTAGPTLDAAAWSGTLS